MLWPKEEITSNRRAPIASRRRVTVYRSKRGGDDATTTLETRDCVSSVLLIERRQQQPPDHQRIIVRIPFHKNARHVEDVSCRAIHDTTQVCDVARSTWKQGTLDRKSLTEWIFLYNSEPIWEFKEIVHQFLLINCTWQHCNSDLFVSSFMGQYFR